MNPELANRLRRFGETVDHAAVAAQTGRNAPGEPTTIHLVEADDTDELPTVVPITARKAIRYRVITAAAAGIIVVAAGALIMSRISGESDPGPSASTAAVTVNTTARPSSTTSTTTTTAVTTTVPVVPVGGPTSTSTSSSTTTTVGSGSSSGTTPATAPRICPNGYHPYDNRYPIRLCDEGPAVELIQLHVGAPENDGAFGPATQQSVRVFQGLKNLEVDGLVGRNTWTAMFPDGAPGTDTDGSGIVDPWEVTATP